MKNVLVLGAGYSSPYLISYLLKEAEKYNWFVNVCDRDYELARKRVNGRPRGNAVEFDVNDAVMRKTLIKHADVVINFLSPTFQYLIALECLHHGKHCISASYENPGIADLHKDAMRKGILILNEMGLDPGIDHMGAMSLINRIRHHGGTIKSFISYGSGLPTPDVNSNPLKYCITWNPRNVVMAGEAGAQYLEKGKIKILPYHEVFQRTWNVEVEGIGTLEAYPNRDSLIYQKQFKLQKVDTMIRGTLRYPGWSETWNELIKLGIPNETLKLPEVAHYTYAQFTEMFLPLNISGSRLEPRVANFLNISPTGKIMENLRWLGLFSNEKIGKNYKTAADLLIDLVTQKMPLPKGAKDMVILVHEVIAEYHREKKIEKTNATLVDFAEPDKYTAIAKTVGAPAGIAAKLILTDELPLSGCHIPTHPLIYTKVLSELKELGISFQEKTEEIYPDEYEENNMN